MTTKLKKIPISQHFGENSIDKKIRRIAKGTYKVETTPKNIAPNVCYKCGNEMLKKEKESCIEYNRLTGKKKRIDLCPECAEKVDEIK